MYGYFSIIKYYPDTNRDEGFGVGIILLDATNQVIDFKVSNERIKRINTAFGINKSFLVDFSVNQTDFKAFDKMKLDYLAVYENGSVRFTKPALMESEDIKHKFIDLYYKYVADYDEDRRTPEVVLEQSKSSISR
jgi:hypothetical protein